MCTKLLQIGLPGDYAQLVVAVADGCQKEVVSIPVNIGGRDLVYLSSPVGSNAVNRPIVAHGKRNQSQVAIAVSNGSNHVALAARREIHQANRASGN